MVRVVEKHSGWQWRRHLQVGHVRGRIDVSQSIRRNSGETVLNVQMVDVSIAHRVEIHFLGAEGILDVEDDPHANLENHSRLFARKARNVLSVRLADDDRVAHRAGVGIQHDPESLVLIDAGPVAEDVACGKIVTRIVPCRRRFSIRCIKASRSLRQSFALIADSQAFHSTHSAVFPRVTGNPGIRC